ncbi:MAG: hypothetical protein HY731_01395, partial [Candidatus Tectomicrobia bacterium]|nr:hypothetical protein [Candidatus Tectomicrobia bacterium]
MTTMIALPVPDAATDRGLASYIRAIEEAGGECRVVRPSDKVDSKELIS